MKYFDCVSMSDHYSSVAFDKLAHIIKIKVTEKNHFNFRIVSNKKINSSDHGK